MPKIIENLQDTILTSGEKLLMINGYKSLTIRQVAAECHIAAGTIYNYYASKDALVAHIMFKDWTTAFGNIGDFLTGASDALQGLTLIFNVIRDFADRYRSIWGEYGNKSALTVDRHRLLIDQIAGYIRPLLTTCDGAAIPGLETFIAEVFLNSASRADSSFESIKPYIIKLIQ